MEKVGEKSPDLSHDRLPDLVSQIVTLSNSNLHSFPTNGLHSLPDNSMCHFPYSWKPSLIMWMLLDRMMRGFLPQCKCAPTNSLVLMGLRNSPCLHLELTWNLWTLVKCMITAILMKRR